MEPISIILLGVLGLLIVGVLNFSFKGGQFTCSRYILNTYMYIFLSLVILMLEILGLDKLGYKSFMDLPLIRDNFVWLIPYLIMLLVLVISVQNVNPQNVVLKHSLWLLLILMLGMSTLVFYKVAQSNNTLHQVLLILVGILGMFTTIAFIKPEWISMSWGPVLLFSLIALIITQIVVYIFFPNRRNVKILAYVAVVLFTLFILYDTKRVQENAKTCVEGKADYINESLNLFLDILNIFQNLVMIKE